MLKHLYKFLILLAVFGFSLYYFSGDIKVEDRQERLETVEMGKASYPTLSIILDDYEVNLLHGYSNYVNARTNREGLLPLDNEQSFKIRINEYDYEIKRVDYELRSIYDDKLIEADNIKALEKEGDNKFAKIRFKSELSSNQEYYTRITLVTNKSKKINFYTRIKSINDSYYKEKLDYVKGFHDSTLNKDESISIYLEETDALLDSLSHVTVNSSFDLVTWGGLNPKVVGEITPTIKEISNEFASIELKYMVSAETKSETQYYYVDEFYRIRHSQSRMYLLDYERTMESVFNSHMLDGTTGEINLGISNNPELELVHSSDLTKVSFVFNRELWYFDQANQEVVKVFSFMQDESDYIRDAYDQHNIKIINIDENGNIDFMVYGYMNRGAYEGYVGMVLYRFYNMDNRIEELVYIPVNETYQFLKEMIGDFNYINELETYYFHINDTIYGYNLITRKIKEITSSADEDDIIFSNEEQYIAWEEKDESGLSKKIIIYDLESEEKTEIVTEGDTVIKLLETVGVDIVYGIANTNDLITTIEGEKIIPMNKLVISNQKGRILKEYQGGEYVILDIGVEDNIITIKRGVLSTEKGDLYIVPAKDDNILSNMDLINENIKIEKKDSEVASKEWYIKIPSLSSSKEQYDYKQTINTVVTKDTTLRFEKEIEYPGQYIVYALGDVMGIHKNASQAISQADNFVGLVFGANQHLIWERGFTESSNQINDIGIEKVKLGKDSFEASVITILKYKYNNTNIPSNLSGYEMLMEYFGDSYINLTGTELEEVLYFVSENRPVIAMDKVNNYVVITGYNSHSINILDPLTGKQKSISIDQAQSQFEEHGNVFISYSE